MIFFDKLVRDKIMRFFLWLGVVFCAFSVVTANEIRQSGDFGLSKHFAGFTVIAALSFLLFWRQNSRQRRDSKKDQRQILDSVNRFELKRDNAHWVD